MNNALRLLLVLVFVVAACASPAPSQEVRRATPGVPFLRITAASLSPDAWSFELGPDGTWALGMYTGPWVRHGRFDAEKTAELFHHADTLVTEEKEELGTPVPDGGTLRFELTTVDGTYRCDIVGRSDDASARRDALLALAASLPRRD